MLELVGPHGISELLVGRSEQLRAMQSGYVFHYAFVLLLAATALLSLVLFVPPIAE